MSLSQIKDWIGRHADLSPEDRTIKRYPSGKEIRVFEGPVAILLTPGRKANLTDQGFVDRRHRDSYEITETGRTKLNQLIEEQLSWNKIMQEAGINFDDEK